MSQYSRRNSDNVSEQGSSIGNQPVNLNNSISGVPAVGADGKMTKGKVSFPTGHELASGSFYNKSLNKNQKSNNMSP
jgi:hypothetical protein